MPRAKPYPEADDEASTFASQWEDEASTTVEQGQIADKLRGLGLPPTKPGNSTIAHANGNVTQTGTGTNLDEMTVDDGQAREVLSAITPIRPEVVARLVITAGNDAGREVEIRPGKTYTVGRAIDNDVVLTDISVSRKHFDLKYDDNGWVVVDRGSGNGTVVNGNLEDNPFLLASNDVIEIGNTVFRFDHPNGAPRVSAPTYDLEEEELSTVAGKPVREEEAPPPPRAALRPKTVPPPMPIRPTNHSTPPPLAGFTMAHQQPPPPLQPAAALPLPPLANRQPLVGPGSPTMLGDAMGMPVGPMGPMGPMDPMGPMGPMGASGANNLVTTLPGQVPPLRPSFPYPQANATDIPPHSVHAQMLMIQAQNRRGDLSTAHVPPVPYHAMPMGVPARAYGTQSGSRRTKLLLAGVGLAVLTGIVTAAIVKSSATPKTTAAATTNKATKAAKAETKPTTKPTPTVEPIKDVPEAQAPQQEPAKADATRPVATTPPSKQESPTQEQPEVTRQEPEVRKQEPKVAREEPTADRRRESSKRESKREREREPAPKRVAAAVDSSAALEKAESLYRDKNFNGASKYLAAAAKSADGREAKQLRYSSDMYAKLGRAYANGTAPGQRANVAFEALQQASNYDRNLANAFEDDIQSRIASIAPKAAIAYLAKKQYQRARTALIIATKRGSTDSNLKLVNQKLEAVAGELYNEAAKEISSDPSAAREKLLKVKEYVDSKSPWAIKANALLKKA